MDKKQAFRIARQAGMAMDIAIAKGGVSVSERGSKQRKRHIQRKVSLGIFTNKQEKRVKKAGYVWGTLVSNVAESLKPKSVRGQSHGVIKRYQKAEFYKQKINSRKWKAGRLKVSE